jgi:uncharacterized membrane protein
MSRPVEGGGTIASTRQALRSVRVAAPMHPIFVHFTIALTAASLVFDASGLVFGAPSLTAAGWWAIVGAITMTLFTLSSGLTSRMRLPIEEGEARSFLRAHMALGPIFFGLLVAAGFWRASFWQAGRSVSWWYLGMMGIVGLVMMVQGYLGGELVYRYGAEVEGSFRRLPCSEQSAPAPSLRSSQAAEHEWDS